MNDNNILPGKCAMCEKVFADRKLRNRHIKRVHKICVFLEKKTNFVCPICQITNIGNYNELRSHLNQIHAIPNVEESESLQFSSVAEFERWKDENKIESTYAVERNITYKNHKEKHFACNRSKNRSKYYYTCILISTIIS